MNRTWAYFFGTGLVEPIDEMVGSSTTASNPELLDLLASEFAEHKFDMKFLFRAITATQAYQLSSVATHKSQDESALFARMPLRGLTRRAALRQPVARRPATAIRAAGTT